MFSTSIFSVGGSVISVIATINHEKNETVPLVLTYPGHVCQALENGAQAAYTQLCKLLSIEGKKFKISFHAIEDERITLIGGSFALPIAMALASLSLNKPIPEYYAFTGAMEAETDEILPVGGLK